MTAKSNVTITWLWDDGFDFALISYIEWEDAGKPIDYMKVIASVEPRERPDRPDPWHGVERAPINSPARSTTPHWVNTPILVAPSCMVS